MVTVPDVSSGSSAWSLAGGDNASPRVGLRLQYSGTGTGPVFVAKLASAPTLAPDAGFDWPVTAVGFTGTSAAIQSLQINSSDSQWTVSVSSGDIVYFGMLNYVGRAHIGAPMTVTLSVDMSAFVRVFGLTPSLLSIVLGVAMSIFLCISLTVCRRCGARWIFMRRQRRLWGGALPPGTVLGPGGVLMSPRARPPPPRGLDAAVIAALPETVWSSGAHQGVAVKEEDAICSVCLAEYEPGERVRTLPYCGHMFHTPCIDEWLASHQTCPLCRVNLAEARTAGGERMRRRESAPATSQEDDQAPAPADGDADGGGGGTPDVEMAVTYGAGTGPATPLALPPPPAPDTAADQAGGQMAFVSNRIGRFRRPPGP
jgi:hypothetical protein